MSEQEPGQAKAQYTYRNMDQLLDAIPGQNGEACRAIYTEHKELIEAAPGSAQSHQAWPGGYYDHILDAMNTASLLYDSLDAVRTLPFDKADALLVMFLHDLEKPFKYKLDSTGTLIDNPDLATKAARAVFRNELLVKYGLTLTAQQQNAMKYVEGVRDVDYGKGQRLMGELATLCNAADTISARLWYNHPLPNGNDEWQGASRISAQASSVILGSEIEVQ